MREARGLGDLVAVRVEDAPGEDLDAVRGAVRREHLRHIVEQLRVVGGGLLFPPYPQSRFPPSCIFMYIHVFGVVYMKNMNIHEAGKRD